MELLSVKNLHVDFCTDGGAVEVVSGVDFSLEPGEIVGLVGESGSGKSVTMKAIIGMLPKNGSYTAEHIFFDGQDLLQKDNFRAIRGRSIANIFQDPMTSLNPLKRVGAHITEVLIRHRGLSKSEAKKEAVELLREVGIPNPEARVRAYPHELSGGMRQRVLIAMALACRPKLLIADEPTTALDVTIQAQILELIARLQKEERLTVVLITHNLAIVENMCHRVVVMYGGLIMEQAAAEELFAVPRHPYTQALLNATPSENRNERLRPITGQPPQPVAEPKGCPFAPRCERAAPRCFTTRPELLEVSPGHFARCAEDI